MSKYRNQKIDFEGYTFDSKKELNRFIALRLLLTAKKISNLEHQPEFELLKPFTHQGQKIRGIIYRADFQYIKNGVVHVEDVKSDMTRKLKDYIIKKKLFLSQNPDIIFLET